MSFARYSASISQGDDGSVRGYVRALVRRWNGSRSTSSLTSRIALSSRRSRTSRELDQLDLLSRDSRSSGVVAESIAVQAIEIAPSSTALVADGPTQAAANSGWWLTAPCVSMRMSGWIVGMASDTLAMSVENIGGGAPASSAG